MNQPGFSGEQKARHNCECPRQIRAEMGVSGLMSDTVASYFCAGTVLAVNGVGISCTDDSNQLSTRQEPQDLHP